MEDEDHAVLSITVVTGLGQEVIVSLPASTTTKALHQRLATELCPPTPWHALKMLGVAVDDTPLSAVWPQRRKVTLSCRWDACAMPYPRTREQDQAILSTLPDETRRPRQRRMPREVQITLDPNDNHRSITPFVEGIHLWEADREEWSHVTFLVEAPPGSPYEGCVFAVQVYLRHDYPFAVPHMRVLTPIHHPLVFCSDGGLLILWQDQEIFLVERWAPQYSLVWLLQMFRQQLKLENLAFMCDKLITMLPQQETAIRPWLTDPEGQLKKAKAMGTCFARPRDGAHLTRRELRTWAVVTQGVCVQELIMLLMVVERHRRGRQPQEEGGEEGCGSAGFEVGDLPQELLELIIDKIIMMHISEEESRSSELVLPADWRSRVITSLQPASSAGT